MSASGVFEWSTPADAQTNPCRVSAITSGARSRTIRFVSRRITSSSRGSRSPAASSIARSDGSISASDDDAALGLRHDLLRDHDDVVILELDPRGDQRRKVIALLHLGQAEHRQDRDHSTPLTRIPAWAL